MAFTSVYAWLVTNYQVGDYQGELADRWQTSDDFRVWRFFLRPGMTFENGDPIRPEDVVNSWLRVIRIFKRRHARLDGISSLIGYDAFPASSSGIVGLSSDARSITLRFTKPQPGLLDTLSFGFYAVVHPSCYDPATGEWRDPKKTIASGAYRIRKWTDTELLLERRPDYPSALINPHGLTSVRIVWQSTIPKNLDIAVADSQSSLGKAGYKFYGGAASHIAYLRCQSWNDPHSPLARKEIRRALRDAFYARLEENGVKPVRSFFPLEINGVSELPEGTAPTRIPHSEGIIGLRFSPWDRMPHAAAVAKALGQTAQTYGLRISSVNVSMRALISEWAVNNHSYADDIAGLGTDISLENPDDDVRFMLRPGLGVSLPDPTGQATAVAGRSAVDIQRVNTVLWNDAIIWPLFHYSEGLWARPSLDLSRINRQVNPVPLRLIGWTGSGA